MSKWFHGFGEGTFHGNDDESLRKDIMASVNQNILAQFGIPKDLIAAPMTATEACMLGSATYDPNPEQALTYEKMQEAIDCLNAPPESRDELPYPVFTDSLSAIFIEIGWPW